MDHNKILEEYFTKEELPKVKEKIEKSKNFKEIFEKIKQKQIDISLENLKVKVDKTGKNFEKRFELFKKAVLELEKKDTKKLDSKIDLAKKKIEEKKKELNNKLKQEANKKLPLIGGALYDWAKNLVKEPGEDAGFFDKIFGKFGKMIGIAILSFLGVKKGFEEMQNFKLKEENNNNNEQNSNEDSNNKQNNKKTNEKEKGNKEDNEVIEMGKLESKIGFGILKSFTPNIEKENNDFTETFLKVSKSNISFKDLEVKYLKAGKNGQKEIDLNINGVSKNEIFKLSKILFSDYAFVIYDSKLTTQNIENILKDKSITKIFTNKEIENIKAQLKNGNFEYKNLNLVTITKLITLSFKGVIQAGSLLVKNKMIDLKNLISSKEFSKDIEDLFADRKQNLLSKKVLNILVEDTGINLGGEKRVKRDYDIDKFLKGKKEGVDYTQEDKEEIKKFLDFRDSLVTNIKNYDLGLGDEFEKSFNKGINIGKIIVLYTLLNGKKLNQLDDFEKINVYLWISEVLKQSGNSNLSGKYLGILWNKATDNNDPLFTENQRKILTIISFKALKYAEQSFIGETKGKIDFINQQIVDLLPDFIGDRKTKEKIVEYIEWGAIAALISYLVLGKKNPILKITLASSGILGYLALIASSEGFLSKLGTKIEKDELKRFKKELDKMLKELKPNLKTKNGKTQIIDSLEVANMVRKGKTSKEIDTYRLKGKYIYYGSDGKLKVIKENESDSFSQKEPIFIENNTGFYITYKGNKLTFDTNTNILTQFIDNEVFRNSDIDKFRGYTLNMSKISIDPEKKEIVFGGDHFRLKIEDIANKLKNGNELEGNFGNIKYYIIAEDGDDKLILYH